MTWNNAKIGDLFEVARGGSPRPIADYVTDDPDGVNWFLIGDAKDGSKFISSTAKRIRRDGVAKSRTVQPGDFLLTNSMSFGRPYIAGTEGCIHDGWLVLKPKTNKVWPDFLYYFLSADAAYREFERRASGAVVKNLNTSIVRDVQIPLPALTEQKRIAAILDAADALRAKRRESLELLDELVDSVFLTMFGDPVTNPKEWKTVALDEIGVFRSGGTPSRQRADYWNGSIPWVSPKDMKVPVLSDAIEHVTDLALKETNLRLLEPGTLLMVVRGMILAHSFPVGFNTVPVAINQDMKGVELRPELLLQFTLHCLQLLERAVVSEASSAGHGTRRLDASAMGRIRVPVPSLALQHEFASIIGTVESQRNSSVRHLAELDTLFASLQSRAFRGEL